MLRQRGRIISKHLIVEARVWWPSTCAVRRGTREHQCGRATHPPITARVARERFGWSTSGGGCASWRAAPRHLNLVHGHRDEEETHEVRKDEGTTAILAHQVRKAPDITNADGVPEKPQRVLRSTNLLSVFQGSRGELFLRALRP